MSKTEKTVIVFLSLFLLLILPTIVFVELNLPEKSPDIDGELGVLLYSPHGLNLNECYVIFAGEMQKPIKAPTNSVVFKFDPQMEKPQVKIWLKEKEVAEKAEIWFKDKDQLREYLR